MHLTSGTRCLSFWCVNLSAPAGTAVVKTLHKHRLAEAFGVHLCDNFLSLSGSNIALVMCTPVQTISHVDLPMQS